nr:MAG TPA: hypothetical protein [Crassvirales sp.]
MGGVCKGRNEYVLRIIASSTYSLFLKSQIFFIPLWWPSNEAA